MKPLSLEVDFKATKKELEELHNEVRSRQGVAILLAHTLLAFLTSGYPGRHRFPHQRLGGAASRPLLPLPHITAVVIIIEPVDGAGAGRLLVRTLPIRLYLGCDAPICLPLTTGSIFMTLAVEAATLRLQRMHDL